jgi:hypothetical protein
VKWARDPRTGVWEINGVPENLRATFSKRHGQVDAQLRREGLDPAAASTAQAKQAAATSREAKRRPGQGGDLRADWHDQARTAGHTPATIITAAMPGPTPTPSPAPDHGPRPDHRPASDQGLVPVQAGPPAEQCGVEQLVDVSERDVAGIAARVLAGPAPEIGARGGLTEHRKVVTRAEVLAGVMDAVPGGLATLAEGERLTDAVLRQAVAVALPAAGATHLTNAARYTSTEIVTAEREVLTAAADRHAGGYAPVRPEIVDLAIAGFEAGAGFPLSAEQRAVVTRLATAGHGVETVVGVAGAGKTTLMSALRSAHEAAGHTVAGAATAAAAAKNLQTEAGITSRTVASWLHRIDTHGPAALAGIDVLIIDEAAMVDDRHTARLLTAAGATGTQVVAIGDPLQLRAIGVGGTFAAIHQLIAGGELTENRRQRDHAERAALAAWRAGRRAATITAWATSGRVHVADHPDQVHEEMAAAWEVARQAWPDPYERIEQLLLLAHTNTDVAALNHRARVLARQAGDLVGPDQVWAVTEGRAAGTVLRLAVGDQVMTTINDPRLGVLNGHRGIITTLDPAGPGGGRVEITRSEVGPDGPTLVSAWLPAAYLTGGGLTHAYAITAAKAQGLTADRALVYGNAMDAHVLYPAMSRDRTRADLHLALAPLEDDATRARHGHPTTDHDRLARAVTAYTTTLNTSPDTLISTNLGWTPPPLHTERVEHAEHGVERVGPAEHVDVMSNGSGRRTR